MAEKIESLSREEIFNDQDGLLSKLGNIWNDSDNDEDSKTTLPKTDYYEHYEFEGVIAHGGIKKIRRYKDTRTGRSIALATLKEDFQSIKHVERFLREARILGQLEHTNIVPLYEMGFDHESLPFLSMRLLKGGTLADLLKEIRDNEDLRKEYPVDRMLQLFMKVCDAIAYAHSQSIVHLDLKPENIQINEFGEILVLDWGFAKKLSDPDIYDDKYEVPIKETNRFTPVFENLTQAGSICGTPGYMSPEQAGNQGNTISTASDIYSLGATLFAMLTTQRPFEGKSVQESVDLTRNGQATEFIRAKESTLPTPLKAIISKAMALKASNRYSKVEELQDDIQAYLSGHGTQAEELSSAVLLYLYYKRNYKLLNMVIIIALILVGGFYQIGKEKEISRQNEKKAQLSENKIQATLNQVINGVLQEQNLLRGKLKYYEILKLYNNLIDLGYDDPRIWLEMLRLKIGFLKLKEAKYYVDKIEALTDHPIKKDHRYTLIVKPFKKYYQLSQEKPLSLAQKVQFSWELAFEELKAHICWTINNDPKNTLEEKLRNIPKYLVIYNSPPLLSESDIKMSYSIKNGKISLNLSDNPDIYHLSPIIGLPIEKLELRNCFSLNIDPPVLNYIFQDIEEIDLSGSAQNMSYILNESSLKKLTARESHFYVINLGQLTHLDIQGATIKTRAFHSVKHLEHLNIAYTNFKHFPHLQSMPKLKTLTLDNSMKLDPGTLENLMARGVKILYVETISSFQMIKSGGK